MGKIDTKVLAIRIAAAAKEKKAEDVKVLDMRKVAGFCDYFVLISANSLRQANAVAQAVVEELEKENLSPLSRIPAQDESGWLVLDYSSVIAHIFYKPVREFYALERLWSDAKKVSIPRKKLPVKNA